MFGDEGAGTETAVRLIVFPKRGNGMLMKNNELGPNLLCTLNLSCSFPFTHFSTYSHLCSPITCNPGSVFTHYYG